MQILIDNALNRPVYQQIMDQVKRDIAVGTLKKGEKLPTVRELAAQLVLNPNTIAKAYRQLERDGIILTRPGAGTYVAKLGSNLSDEVKRRILCQQIELLGVDAIHMQVRQSSLKDWFNQMLKKFDFPEKEGQLNE